MVAKVFVTVTNQCLQCRQFNDVVHAESTNTFKSRLDKFWSNQEIIYRLSCQNSRNWKSKCKLLEIVLKYCILVLEY